MGSASNVESISFQNNALAPNTVTGVILDRDLNVALPVLTVPVSTRPPLASQPSLLFNQPNVRKKLLVAGMRGGDAAEMPVALNIVQATARAQAMVDASTDHVVTATGALDSLRYGELLQARGIVGVRGVGLSYDGNYYVQSVTHSIRKGEYKQRFTLHREGVGSLTPFVRP